MFKIAVTIVLGAACCACAATGADVNAIRAHKQYALLSDTELRLVEKIMTKAVSSSKRDYYFFMLTLLLDTTTVPTDDVADMNTKRLEASVAHAKEERRAIAHRSESGLEEYLNLEETYEMETQRQWTQYCPSWFGSCFYVVDNNPKDILVHIQVHLIGNVDLIEEMLSLEDSVEKHLSIPGFSVNLVFVGMTGDDIFDVTVDPSKWATSENWTGSYYAMAHELMHLMGLPDEYDRIENHAANAYMEREQRLWQFLGQMDDVLPADAKNGIMCYSFKRPLDRQVCAAVGLGNDCADKRKELY